MSPLTLSVSECSFLGNLMLSGLAFLASTKHSQLDSSTLFLHKILAVNGQSNPLRLARVVSTQPCLFLSQGYPSHNPLTWRVPTLSSHAKPCAILSFPLLFLSLTEMRYPTPHRCITWYYPC